jgi:predicted HAD superfamily phosphohydrolase
MKKATQKELPDDDVVIEPIQPKYTIWMKFNDQEYTIQSDDVASAILSVKPEFLFTELYMTIKADNMSLEREFTLVQGKRLFNNEDNIEIFTSNLLF